jgi:3-hydroxyacyl-[acyl-carrier-protein] dehydratase
MPVIESDEIQRILPHRSPILMVDRIIECDDLEHVVGIKCVTANEPFLQGHFPGEPIMPGVLQLEAMAQAAGVLMGRRFKYLGRVAYFLAVDKARFRRVVRPGDVMRIEVDFGRARLGMTRMQGRVLVDGELACEAEIMFGYRDE